MTDNHRTDSLDGQPDPIELAARACELYVPARPEFRESVRASLAKKLDRRYRPAMRIVAAAASLLIIAAGVGGYAAGQGALGFRGTAFDQRLHVVESEVTAQRKEYETTIQKLREAMTEAEKKTISAIQSDLKSARAEVDWLSSLVGDVPKTIQKLEAEAKAQREKLEAEVMGLRVALTKAEAEAKTATSAIRSELKDTQANLKDMQVKVGELSARVADIPKTTEYVVNIFTNDPKLAGQANNIYYNAGHGGIYEIPQPFGRRVKYASVQISSSIDQQQGLNALWAEIVEPNRVKIHINPSNNDIHGYGVRVRVDYVD